MSRRLLAVVSAGFAVLAVPVLGRAAPLLDDHFVCARVAEMGLVRHLVDEHLPFRGIVRPIHMLEISWIGALCGSVPFWVLILPGLGLTIWVAWALRGLLRDLGLASPWPEVAGVVWLLQPLGFEAALWPSAVHLPLGLGLALVSLRRFRAGRVTAGVVLAVLAYLCNEVMFVLPLLVWLATPTPQRRRATAWTVAPAVLVLALYAVWPGSSARTAVGLTDRIVNVFRDPRFYLRFPVIGLGLHSIPSATVWAFPGSLLALLAGAAAGAVGWPRLLDGSPVRPRGDVMRWLAVAVVLVVLVNLPSLSVAPRDDSPRIFTPTWLLVSGLVAYAGAHTHWRRPLLGGAVAGLLAAGAVLSLALSAAVRADNVEFARRALSTIAERTDEGDVVAVCDTPFKQHPDAPAGAFALHDFQPDYELASLALRYHTGRSADIRVAAPGPCPATQVADLVLTFDELQAAVGARD